MNSMMSILPLFALPNIVLAITCNTCTPNPPTVLCTKPGDLNVTDCDADYDVCIKKLAVAKRGQMKQTRSMFRCGMKAECQDLQAKSCNASYLQPEETFEKCEATCCEQDMCNGLVDNTSPSVNASPGVPVKPTATVVSFATIFTSALFVLFFVY
ncbi:uncharacterized protein [Pocillopora verrucosa]|uniref:uncharacterized protein n=1 Tax=Pocillopora verrucosa TaxID=203993 RepID=UPI00333FCBD5